MVIKIIDGTDPEVSLIENMARRAATGGIVKSILEERVGRKVPIGQDNSGPEMGLTGNRKGNVPMEMSGPECDSTNESDEEMGRECDLS